MKIPTGGILFFDSGIGGLTVLAETLSRFNEQVFLYYGDNDYAPYGNLPEAQIRENVDRVFQDVEDLDVRLAVLACNTATAVCAESLRANYAYPIVGAEPAIMPAVRQGGRVLALATRATCESERFRRLCDKARRTYPQTLLQTVACENLAGAIEKNICNESFDPTIYLPSVQPTAVVLGCTHYIYAKEKIERFYACPVYDGNAGIAERVKSLFEKKASKIDDRRAGRPLKTPTISFNAPNAFFGNAIKQNFRETKGKEGNSKGFVIDGNGNRIFFLGTQKLYNKRIFEQMFVKCRK